MRGEAHNVEVYGKWLWCPSAYTRKPRRQREIMLISTRQHKRIWIEVGSTFPCMCHGVLAAKTPNNLSHDCQLSGICGQGNLKNATLNFMIVNYVEQNCPLPAVCAVFVLGTNELPDRTRALLRFSTPTPQIQSRAHIIFQLPNRGMVLMCLWQ